MTGVGDELALLARARGSSASSISLKLVARRRDLVPALHLDRRARGPGSRRRAQPPPSAGAPVADADRATRSPSAAASATPPSPARMRRRRRSARLRSTSARDRVSCTATPGAAGRVITRTCSPRTVRVEDVLLDLARRDRPVRRVDRDVTPLLGGSCRRRRLPRRAVRPAARSPAVSSGPGRGPDRRSASR